MTKLPKLPTSAANDNILDFPNTSVARLPGEHVALDNQVPDGIPEGFTLHNDDIYQHRPGDGDDQEPVKICSPLVVKVRCRRPDRTGWGSVIALQDPDGNWHELIVDASVISRGPATVIRPLLDRGLVPTTATKATQSVTELLAGWQPTVRYDRVDHLGWVDGDFKAFTLGDCRILGNARVNA